MRKTTDNWRSWVWVPALLLVCVQTKRVFSQPPSGPVLHLVHPGEIKRPGGQRPPHPPERPQLLQPQNPQIGARPEQGKQDDAVPLVQGVQPVRPPNASAKAGRTDSSHGQDVGSSRDREQADGSRIWLALGIVAVGTLALAGAVTLILRSTCQSKAG